ncbi:MAG: anaerobic c4-dicarboxylate antiporter, DcuC family [Firmicutes bacterium]|nr:anaerobic c4-dicarboxylate antiporter, DcuC family [Bacillota bacterium]
MGIAGIIGIVIILITVYLLIRQYETRMVLGAMGILMAVVAGKPMAAFDAFAKNIIDSGMITAIVPVMGFALVMKATECDKHLISLMANVMRRIRPILIPGTVMATFATNVALPSAAGCGAAVGAIFIPLLISSGIHPAMAASAVLAGTAGGSALSPGNPHNPYVAKIANVDVMSVITVVSPTGIIAGGVVLAICLTIVAKFFKEDSGYEAEESMADQSSFKPNPFYAIVPIIPVSMLLLGATGVVSALKPMGIAHTMLIGAIIGIAITRSNPSKSIKAFFDGMASGYGEIVGIIIAAGVFISGMMAVGLVDAFLAALKDSARIVKYAATFGPFLLAVITGSGNAAALAFNGAITPHAQQFGQEIINMGTLASLCGSLGRTMSPVGGVVIICAAIAKVSPMELAKRNAPGCVIAAILAMFMLLN